MERSRAALSAGRSRTRASSSVEIRAMVPAAPSVSGAVAEIIAAVAAEGDTAVARYTAQFDLDPPPPLRVEAEELSDAVQALDEAVRSGLEVTRSRTSPRCAWSGTVDRHRDRRLAESRATKIPHPRDPRLARRDLRPRWARARTRSTVVMGAVTARAASVVGHRHRHAAAESHAVTLRRVRARRRLRGLPVWAARRRSPPSPTERRHSRPGCRCDRRPRQGLYVQEAKRQLSDRVGIDGFAGPSDLLVLLDASDAGSGRLIAHDLLAPRPSTGRPASSSPSPRRRSCSTRSRPTCARCGAARPRQSCS